jgi:hypothetical protein
VCDVISEYNYFKNSVFSVDACAAGTRVRADTGAVALTCVLGVLLALQVSQRNPQVLASHESERPPAGVRGEQQHVCK